VAEAPRLIVDCIKAFLTNPRLCHFACGTLSNLVHKNAKHKAVVGKAGAVKAVADVMDAHLFDAAVQLTALSFLRNYTAMTEQSRAEVGAKGCVERIVKALKEHASNETLYYWGCGVLNNVCRETLKGNKAAAKAAGALDLVKAAAETYPITSDARRAAMELVGRLSTN
jgi:hypothetical protein